MICSCRARAFVLYPLTHNVIFFVVRILLMNSTWSSDAISSLSGLDTAYPDLIQVEHCLFPPLGIELRFWDHDARLLRLHIILVTWADPRFIEVGGDSYTAVIPLASTCTN